MYPAQNAPASRANHTPRSVPPVSTPASTTTPATASNTAVAERSVRVPNAATATGPRNSIETALPSGTTSTE